MATKTDQIMALAYEFADAKVAHHEAVVKFGNDLGDYAPIPVLAKKWQKAEKALRKAVEEVAG